MTETTLYREHVLAEIDTLPDEYLPFVLRGAYAAREHYSQASRREFAPRLGEVRRRDLPGR